MSIIKTKRHPTIDAVLQFLATCDRCRNPVSPDFGPCSRCGREHLDATGKVSVFVADPVLRTFRWRMRDWLADRWELPELVFVHENAQAIRLFCAVARCSQCNQPEISSDTLHCYVCGRSAQVCERGKVVQGVLTGRLPVGFRMLLQSHYLTARRAAGFRNQNVLLPVGISLRPNGHFMSSKAVDATTASGHWRPCEHQEVGSAIISRPGSTEALTPRRISRLPAGTVTNRRAGGTRTSTGLCCSHVSVEPRFQDGGKRWRTFEHGATGKLAESSLASRRAP